MSFEVIKEFENKVSEYFGSPYGIAIDSCTHGLELCLRLFDIPIIEVPKRTYLSVPMLANKLNKSSISFEFSVIIQNKKYNYKFSAPI